jgi:hypothetical protein
VLVLLVDLDNTLIDRAGAFDRWARDFASARRGGAADAQWLAVADRDGPEPRERLAGLIAERSASGGRLRFPAALESAEASAGSLSSRVLALTAGTRCRHFLLPCPSLSPQYAWARD